MHYNRSERLPYESEVFLMIPIEPWALSFQLTSANLSKTGLCAFFNLNSLSQETTKEDIDLLLQTDDLYKLQIESLFDHLEAPTLTGKLVRKSYLGKNLQLAFQFEETPDSLLNLIAEFMV